MLQLQQEQLRRENQDRPIMQYTQPHHHAPPLPQLRRVRNRIAIEHRENAYADN